VKAGKDNIKEFTIRITGIGLFLPSIPFILEKGMEQVFIE
jgi:hypothetical protein